MAKMDMVMPQMGESIAEGTILKWLKAVGDKVEKDENILEISTDKVDSEIPSPASGVLVELKADEGDVIPVGDVVAVIETDASAGAASPKRDGKSGAKEDSKSAAKDDDAAPDEAGPDRKAKPDSAAPRRDAKSEAAQAAPAAPTARQDAKPSAKSGAESGSGEAGAKGRGSGEVPRRSGDSFYSPLVRSIAREEGVSLEELESLDGSGREGRITKDDILAYVKNRGSAKAAAKATPASQTDHTTRADASQAPGGAEAAGALPQMAQAMPAMPVYTAPATAGGKKPPEKYPLFEVQETRTTADGPVDVVPMDRMRTLIAEHMVRSKATSPHVASVTEVDMTAIVRFREATKSAFQKSAGIKLTYTPFIAQAAVKALADYPMVNSTVEDGQILVKRFVNLGVAVALDSGLIVPVIKHAEEKNFLGLARGIDDLANRARSRQLRPDDVAGGTFTVTNMGSFGNLFGIPIINQPQSGILGVGAIIKRPVVVGDAIAIRDIMYLSLSYDHRHVDGKLGGLFIQRVRHYLETFDPASV